MDLNKAPGLEAEQLAGKFLRQLGYRIIEERRWTKYGELDLICRKGRELVFVEVRSVESESGFHPEESLIQKKIDHLVKSAKSWLIQKKLLNYSVRFDIITVDLSEEPPRIVHYPAAFSSRFDL